MKTAQRIILLTAATLLAVTLIGCTSVQRGLFNDAPTGAHPTASPTPAPVALGAVLTKDAALKLRQDIPASGDYAYMMPDGTWVKTNRFQPLPAAVIADQQAMAAAIPLPPATGSAQVSIDAFQVAYKYTARFSYATGKQIVFVSQLLRSLVTANGGANARTWTTIGDLKTNDPFPSAAAAQQSATIRIAAQPDASNWEIIVGN